jgi:predicted component of type VI protein secretion system
MSDEVGGELVPQGGGDNIPLIRSTLVIGRRESCDICLRLPNVSGIHCELSNKDGYWYIRDLGSTNGIKVNGTRVQQKLLHPGDKITIAKRHWTIEYTLKAGKRVMEEMMEDDVMGQSLLEKAGLVRPKREEERRPKSKADLAAEFLLEDDEEDQQPPKLRLD